MGRGKNQVRIENWGFEKWGSDQYPYKAPEQLPTVVTGKIYGHPKFEDGTSVQSGSLIKWDMKEGWAESKNTYYKLGKMNPDYQKFREENENQTFKHSK